MASNWYYEENGNRKGPVDSKTLKQLADNGTIESTTPVWREGMKDWVKAGSVKGLLPKQNEQKPLRESTDSANDGVLQSIKGWYEATWLSKRPVPFQIAAWLFCWHFIIVWYFITKPATSNDPGTDKQRASGAPVVKRLLLGGASFVVIAIGISTVATIVSLRGANAVVNEGDRLWDEGNETAAISEYQKVVDDHLPLVSSERRSRVYSRLIDHYATNGDEQKAKSVFERTINPAELQPQTDLGRQLVETWMAGQITADFFPFNAGTKRHYATNTYAFGPEIQSRVEWQFQNDNTIRTTTINEFVVGGGNLPASLGSDRTIHFRTDNGFIETGESSEYSNGIVWSPVLKLGATQGDEWERRYQNGVVQSYRVDAFDTREINESIDGGGSVECVVVEMRMTAPIGPETIVESVYAEGVGRIREDAWIVENGQRTMTRSEIMMPLLQE